ncbi:type VI secretion system baseplate subunit TssE [Blastopirellula marina]|uniref:Type VI secretion system baseplate subunit TssE n=1 Tax=Blastopirellula marina TaxID=124 RepID=A0A2S8G3B1_9BACT|nr:MULTISPECIES: type VI secretion system baseplate subunit TssE [Pirellulaceae]PQO38939.1 type VI secretion system baseplate subunit TssE [Blastopirellula marina]RCS55247.1 type VI secretion system baseplate subunit TssE [Bremerella cremea]
MSRGNPDEEPLMPSVFDRLIDNDPFNSREAPHSQTQTMREIRESVMRDLENLLNTRWRCKSWPPQLNELNNSLINYGIPDFSSIDLSSDMDRDSLREAIEFAIRTFETRFVSVHVEIPEKSRSEDRTLHFIIRAELHATPAPEPIVFDSKLEPSDHLFHVRRKDR